MINTEISFLSGASCLRSISCSLLGDKNKTFNLFSRYSKIMNINTTNGGWCGPTISDALSNPSYRHITTTGQFTDLFEELKQRQSQPVRLCLTTECAKSNQRLSRILVGVPESGWIFIDQHVIDPSQRIEFLQVLFGLPLLLEYFLDHYTRFLKWAEIKESRQFPLKNFFCLASMEAAFRYMRNREAESSIANLIPFRAQSSVQYIVTRFQTLLPMLDGSGVKELMRQQNMLWSKSE